MDQNNSRDYIILWQK